MKRMLILALAASLLPCASFAQVPMLTTATPLKANSGDQAITLSAARSPFKKGAVIKLCPVTSVTPASSYVAKASTCPTPTVPLPPVVTPPVVIPAPPAPTADKAIVAGNLFLKNSQVIVGLADTGTLGSMVNAPVGYGGAVNGYARRALLSGGIDPLVIGIGADAWMLGYRDDAGTHTIVQGAMINYREMPGASDADGVWRGAKGSISDEQTVTLEGGTVLVTVRLTNIGSSTIRDLTYTRMLDVDDSVFATLNVVTALNTIEAQLQGVNKGHKLVLSSSHPDARVSSYGAYAKTKYDPYAAVLMSQPVGTSRKADENINVTVPLGDLAPGQTVTHSFEMGLL